MSTGMIVYIIMMSWTLIIVGGITFLMYKYEDYTLISGFANRTKEEQEQLIKNGYTQAVKRFLLTSTLILLITFVLSLFRIPWVMEAGFSVLTLHALGGMVYIQRYEVEHKKKRGYWLTGSISAVILIGMIGLLVWSFQPHTVSIDQEELHISGIYGVTIPLEEIEQVERLDRLPPVQMRTNGVAVRGLLKGDFLIEGYGAVRLFVRGEPSPVLYIETERRRIMLNGDEEQLDEWYKTLRAQLQVG
ncbi:hypothetical protein J2S00_001228 [Caldalkalibacillus uzonensis]|uniref:Bacterial Pleckstrin homology domain-containing protein n=1 Tax=Caldalkalibacillus uzonensis TaxID=353224 RepID=A0ABU0CPZ6_9BACI|nr:DUF3784 domain-containing protein [Caldalkalibacillus uzonensis]MDQ0338444.1 hypothetical protein [Caldalkalibacillus uzonensis]